MKYDPESIVTRSHTNSPPAPFDPSRHVDGVKDLSGYFYGITSGDLSSVPFVDWPILSKKTQWGIPGCMTMLIGDPGAGKTFFVLQALRSWVRIGVQCAALFVEKNTRFHMHRMLAQIEKNGSFLDWDFLKTREGGKEAQRALSRNREELAACGQHIHSAPPEDLTMAKIGAWIRHRAEQGDRVIVVDPITAADAGDARWNVDRKFVIGVQRVLNDFGASLILVNHPKGGKEKNPTGHSQSGSAAFFRFSDTDIWLRRHKKVRKVALKRTFDQLPWNDELDTFAEIHKARNGRGKDDEIGLLWNHMHFVEQGCVVRDVKDDGEEVGSQQEIAP